MTFKQAFLEVHPGEGALQYISKQVGKKVAAADEAAQFSHFLKLVAGEIVASFIAAFRVTTRPILNQMPGIGEIQLSSIEQSQGDNMTSQVNAGSRVKYLLDKMSDSELQDCINNSWAQGAVWSDSGAGSFVYETFVRMESIDTDSMIAKYRFICGTKEAN